jgi:hypothetical protein
MVTMAHGPIWQSHTGAAMEIWDLWVADLAATGLSFARGRIDPHAVLWVHAAPTVLSVTVRDGDDQVVARGESLERQGERLPMTRLTRVGDRVVREDRWPTPQDLGSLVILPGGEVGTLRAWQNAPDGSEWRWQVEFYNHR